MKKLLFVSLAPLLAFAASPIDVKFSTDDNAKNGKIVVSVTNHSKQDIEVLKWNTPFEKTLNADIFDINIGSKENIYLGRTIKRAKPQESDYLFLEAGASERVTINMSTYYSMKKKGDYRVTFDGVFKYRLLDGTELKVNEMAKKTLPSINFSFVPKVENKNAISLKQTAKFNSCSQDETKVLKVAHDDAIKISKESMDALSNASKKTSSPRYVTWFGAADETRQKTVTEGFQKIYDAFENKNISFDCGTCKEDTSLYDSTYAYVYPSSQYQVYLCGAFWSSETTGTDTQAGTLVHEVSHFSVVAGTDDHAYGPEDAKNLAKNSPEKAINNAENYDYFAENNPNLSMENSSESNNSIENDNIETNNPEEVENNNSESTDNYNSNQEEVDLNLCFVMEDDNAFEECYTNWEEKYYPYDETTSDDEWNWDDDSWNDNDLNWDNIDWYYKQ
jgi:peptidyl-Lys metalloendopeptidase